LFNFFLSKLKQIGIFNSGYISALTPIGHDTLSQEVGEIQVMKS